MAQLIRLRRGRLFRELGAVCEWERFLLTAAGRPAPPMDADSCARRYGRYG